MKGYKVIYNPHAGKKRHLLSSDHIKFTDLYQLLKRFDIKADFFATQHPGHATELAKAAQEEEYIGVIVAGGDGTVGEAANGLVGGTLPLGILPMGSFMNIARMLAIPFDLERAAMLLKIAHTRTIDVGSLSQMNGRDLSSPAYFIESIGIGLDANVQRAVLSWEHGRYTKAWNMCKALFREYRHPITIETPDQTITTRASLITIANAPLMGAGLELTPESKLNDHRLTIRIYGMTRFEMLRHVLHVAYGDRADSSRILTITCNQVRVHGHDKRLLHADARVFGTLPIEARVIPRALPVITGFPDVDDVPAFEAPTYIDA